jgi:hypothetical protein
MRSEDQCTSRELSMRLYKLGVKQESYFWWVEISENAWFHLDNDDPFDGKIHAHFSSFTVAELGEMLPIEIPYIEYGCDDVSFLLSGKNHDGKWWLNYTNGFEDVKEADVRAKALIYLIENKIIKVPK